MNSIKKPKKKLKIPKYKIEGLKMIRIAEKIRERSKRLNLPEDFDIVKFMQENR